MVETGDKLEFSGIVADKHSIGGVPGTRTTMIVVPIVAAAGFKIPKSSSRAITTPGGTADDFEVLAPVNLSKEKIYSTVKKTNGCIVWGGSFNIAPADDIIIKVEEELLFESYDKILISIMAKKVAFGSTHVVIDLPYGKTVKVPTLADAKILKKKFENLAKRFDIKMEVLVHRTEEPAGRGLGPVLETRESVLVLEQAENRGLDLEARSINLAGTLLELCLADSSKTLRDKVRNQHKNGFNWAMDILKSGKALEKFKEIIDAQGGNSKVTSSDLKPGKHTYDYVAKKNGEIKEFNIKNLSKLTRILGAPEMKSAGIYLRKKLGDSVVKNEPVCTFYSNSVYNLKEGKDSIENFPFVTIR
jgi:AMP phosphorylase